MSFFMARALQAATLSPDPSTQNGAVIVPNCPSRFTENDVTFAVEGHNAFPVGVHNTPDRWERPAKYQYVEHAERAAIYEAARIGFPTAEATMFCPWAACPDCARAIVGAGIIELVRYPLADEAHWSDPVKIGDQILREAGVAIFENSFVGLEIPPLRRNGALWKP